MTQIQPELDRKADTAGRLEEELEFQTAEVEMLQQQLQMLTNEADQMKDQLQHQAWRTPRACLFLGLCVLVCARAICAMCVFF